MKFKDNYTAGGLTFFLIIMILFTAGCIVMMALDIMSISDPYCWVVLGIGIFGIGAWLFCQMIGPYSIIIDEVGIRAKRPIGKWEQYPWDAIIDSGVRRRQTGADVQFSFYFATFKILPCDRICQRTPKQRFKKGEKIFDIYFSKRAVEAIRLYAPERIKHMINDEKHPANRAALNRLMEQEARTEGTDNWRHAVTGTDGHAELFGVNIFDYEWKDTGESVDVTDSLYGQNRIFSVYSVEIKDEEHEFAAGEFSNGVWGFYIKEENSYGLL